MVANTSVSFVIPSYNSESTLAGCLQSIFQQASTYRFQVIVVDNLSIDTTAAIAGSFGAQVIECSVKGPAAARNTGWRACDSEWIAFIDSDVVLPPTWLQEMMTMKEADVGGCQSAIWPNKGLRWLDQFRLEKKYFKTQGLGTEYAPERGRFTLNTAACLYAREVLEFFGGFEETLLRLEDMDFAIKARALTKLQALPQVTASVEFSGQWHHYLMRSFVDGKESIKLQQLWGVPCARTDFRSATINYQWFEALTHLAFQLGQGFARTLMVPLKASSQKAALMAQHTFVEGIA